MNENENETEIDWAQRSAQYSVDQVHAVAQNETEIDFNDSKYPFAPCEDCNATGGIGYTCKTCDGEAYIPTR